MWLLLLMNALFALSFTIAKAVLDYGKPLFFVGVRMVVAGVILMGYIRWAKGKGALHIARKDWGALALLTITHIYFTYVLDLLALQHMSSFKGAFLYNLSPFITAFFSYLYFSEAMTPKKWLGLTIGFSGFLPEIIINYNNATEGSGPLVSWAEIMMIGSVIAACLGWVTLRTLVKKNYTPFVLNGIAMFAGGLASLLTSGLYERWDLESPVYALKPFIGLTALIIVVSNLVLYNMYGFLLRKYTATFISFTGFVIPIFAAFFGWIFLNEAVSWHFAFSVGVVTAGLWLFYSEDLRQGYVARLSILLFLTCSPDIYAIFPPPLSTSHNDTSRISDDQLSAFYGLYILPQSIFFHFLNSSVHPLIKVQKNYPLERNNRRFDRGNNSLKPWDKKRQPNRNLR